PTPQKMMPYECGVDPIGTARRRFSVKFYIIAMLFIIFDIEAVFLYPWAVVFKDLKVFGFIEMGIFIVILFIGLIYAWKKGALEWE
ncbi:MAG: NADH-quinone oxidoreductase subunit A, partial [Pseudomonadota bacterium]